MVGDRLFSSNSTLTTFNEQCKDESMFLETVYIFKPMTLFQIGCSCLALFALYLIEPSHIRGIMPRLPLLSLIITSRKDGDLALSTSFVSPKEGN